jgi:GDP-4-dehydro-6-deoxy-D-mannose reductase
VRALITGASGFAARHLADLLTSKGHQVFGLVRSVGPSTPLALEALAVGDVCDAAVVATAVRRFQPDAIFHLAAQSSVKAGEDAAAATFTVNTIGALQVLGAAERSEKPCRVLLASSGECYGRAAGPAPLQETTALRPVSVYAASKVAAEILARRAMEASGVDVVIARAFNHTGPGPSSRFVCGDFARQIVAVERVAVERGTQPVVRVGNLEAVRDFLDVRDVVRGYLHLCERGERGEIYNVSSGVGRKVADILADLVGLSTAEPEVVSDPERLRAAEVPVLLGDSGRLRRLGWKAEIDWSVTLGDLLQDQRRRQEAQLS